MIGTILAMVAASLVVFTAIGLYSRWSWRLSLEYAVKTTVFLGIVATVGALLIVALEAA